MWGSHSNSNIACSPAINHNLHFIRKDISTIYFILPGIDDFCFTGKPPQTPGRHLKPFIDLPGSPDVNVSVGRTATLRCKTVNLIKKSVSFPVTRSVDCSQRYPEVFNLQQASSTFKYNNNIPKCWWYLFCFLLGNICNIMYLLKIHGSQIFPCQNPLKSALPISKITRHFSKFSQPRSHKLEDTSGLLYNNNSTASQYISVASKLFSLCSKNVHKRCFDRKEFKTSQTTKSDF